IYDPRMPDPYKDAPAQKLGWWIVPFIVDGSRFFTNDTSELLSLPHNDTLHDRPDYLQTPTRIQLLDDSSDDSNKVDSLSTTTTPSSVTFFDGDKLIATF